MSTDKLIDQLARELAKLLPKAEPRARRRKRRPAPVPRTVTVVAEPPPTTFGPGICPDCGRKALLLNSTLGPRCRPCHPATPPETE